MSKHMQPRVLFHKIPINMGGCIFKISYVKNQTDILLYNNIKINVDLNLIFLSKGTGSTGKIFNVTVV